MVLALVILLWPGGGSIGNRLENIFAALSYQGAVIIGILALICIISLIFLVIHAIVKKDGWLGWQLFLLVLLISHPGFVTPRRSIRLIFT